MFKIDVRFKKKNSGSDAFSVKTLLVRIIENNKLMLILGKVKLSKG